MDTTEAKKPTKFFGLSKNVISMGIVSFLNDISSDMICPFIPIFLTSVLGATATFVGLIEGIADATASILKIVSGRLSDKLKRRKPFVVFGYGISAVAKPILAFALAPWHVLVVRFLDRVGKGMRDAPRDALLSFSSDKKHVGRAFGFHRGADTLGAAFGPLIAFAIMPFIQNDLRTLFLLSFIASFFAVVILKIFVWEVRDHHHTITDGPSGGSGALIPEKFKIRYLGIPFLIFLVAATLFSLGKASEAFLLLRSQTLGVAIAFLPIIYFVYNIVFAVVSTPAGIVSDKIGHRNTFMLEMIMFSFIYLLFAEAESATVIWVLFGLYGVQAAFTEGVGRAIVADLVEERWRATAYGIYNATTGIALLPASVIFGILWDKVSPAASFYYGALLGLVAFVIFLFLRIQHRGRIAQTNF